MKKKRLRPYVVPIFSAGLFSALLITVLSLTNKVEENNDFTYVSNSIVNDTIPVINEVEDVYIVRPYQNDQITIYMFRGKGCGYCRKFLEFMNSIKYGYWENGKKKEWLNENDLINNDNEYHQSYEKVNNCENEIKESNNLNFF